MKYINPTLEVIELDFDEIISTSGESLSTPKTFGSGSSLPGDKHIDFNDLIN